MGQSSVCLLDVGPLQMVARAVKLENGLGPHHDGARQPWGEGDQPKVEAAIATRGAAAPTATPGGPGARDGQHAQDSGTAPSGGVEDVELARLAGTTVERIRQLLSLGILTRRETIAPFQLTDIQRVRMADAFEKSGIPIEVIGTAIAEGRFSLDFIDTVFPAPAPRSERTVRQVAGDLGFSVELVLYLYTMWGLPAPDPDEPIRVDDARLLEVFSRLPPEGLTEPALTTAARLFSEGMRKVVDSSLEYFHNYVEVPVRASGMPAGQAISLIGQLAGQLLPLADEMIAWGAPRFMEQLLVEHFVEMLDETVEEAGLRPRGHARLPAVAFMDLTGFTRLTETEGDEQAAEKAVALARLVQETAQRWGGRLVKLLGDGVMFFFPDPDAAVACGLELVERVPQMGLPSARYGVNSGPIVFRDGDYFGRTVNLASRIADYARPGEVLVSEDVVDNRRSDAVAFVRVGDVELKGVSGLVTVFSATPASDRTPASNRLNAGLRMQALVGAS